MADKAPSSLPPASEPFPGSRTPGWNDPPTLQYNAGQGSGRTRLNLNKRVAFPLQGTPAGNSSVAAAKPTAVVPPNQASLGSGLPPPTTSSTSTQPIAVVHPMPGNWTVAGAAAVSMPPATLAPLALPSNALEYTARVLRDQVAVVQETTNVRRDEIERRLGIIEQLWQTNNLSGAVQEKLYRLAKAIADKAFNEAMDIYTALAANNSNECVSWATALRHVVLTLQPSEEEEAPGVPAATAAVIVTTTSDSNNIIPAMYVPAMPRQGGAAGEGAATAIGGSSAGANHTAAAQQFGGVQHI